MDSKSENQLIRLATVLLVVVLVCSLTPPLVVAALRPPHCTDKCGNVTIPYPFGMSPGCYLNESFYIECNTTYTPHQPFLWGSNINVTEITPDGEVHILKYIGKKCPDDYSEPELTLGNFGINDTLNIFVVVGCDSYGYLQGVGFTTGCMSICNNLEDVNDGTCDGVGCCQTSIPKNMLYANQTLGSFYNHTSVSDFNPCTFAFLVEKRQFKFSPENLTNLQDVEKLPMVLAWSIGNETCQEAKKNETSYACKENSICDNMPEGYPGYRCSCLDGYDGNPYLSGPDGCQDINECQRLPNGCTYQDKKYCKNTIGNYTCSCPKGYTGDGRGEHACKKNQNMKVAYIVIVIAFGIIAFLLAAILLNMEIKRRRSKRTKQKFFLQNGGVLLQEKLTGRENLPNMVRIFSSSEVQKATNDFHNNMIIGQGGFGTVYRGVLPNNSIVAIKKSRRVDPHEIEQFINEVYVLSQVNHRNVVRLLGCCLETEVPLLVYEFINNGTLSSHIHNQAKAHFFKWEMRLKIAAETAGVLSYLHSAASTPIIHRDVKSDNILLDHTFTAKVSDFGSSKLVPLDLNQLSTMVQGTFGYLDPEYMQTNQLTEKSDVYSFGVVLLELLTGRKAISFDKPEEEKSLANFFLSMLKQERLSEILDGTIVSHGNMEQILEVARLAKECLNMKGEDRPSMKEVSMELEGLILGGKHSWARNADNVEETECLLCDGERLDSFANGDSINTSVGYDSIRDHVLLPVSGGR